ncbi:hypothetical protein [Pseudonocardia spirodelae]|uniref:DUF5666 domain-containing protein n=1 Tax=Pseudonocardia spirodelae TaxID=3133431 RepID=A0ABU8T5U0_9PSEU
MRMLQKAAVVGATAIGLVGAGVGSAWAGTPAPQPAPVAAAPAAAQPAAARQAAPVTVAGTVVRNDGRTLQVRDRTGRVTTVQAGPRTAVTKNGRQARFADVTARDRVTVTAQRQGTALVATRVVDTGR